MPFLRFQYDQLQNSLEYIRDVLGFDIHIMDFTGSLENDAKLRNVVSPYFVHSNYYCQYVKANQELWNKCIFCKRYIIKKLERCKSPFSGVCHCGIKEYIFPFFYQDEVVGYISFGSFLPDEQIVKKRLERICKQFNFDFYSLREVYYENVRKQTNEHTEKFVGLLGMAASLLSAFTKESCLNISRCKNLDTQQRLLMIHATEFIREKYSEELFIDDIAKFCNCSRSYLQHLFKRYFNTTISAYLEKIRIEKARIMLKNSDLPVYIIASNVGYKDANYFATVFRKHHNMAPTQFRKSLS